MFVHTARRTGSYLSGRSAARVLQRISALLTVACSVALLATASVFVPASWAVDTRIAKLEMKFFRHDYPEDAIHLRLERLEKMVFGIKRQGSESERLSRLMSAVPTFDPTPSPARTHTARNSRYRHHPLLRDDRLPDPEPEPESSNAGQQADTAFTPPSSSKYPAVSAIEKSMFGKDFGSEHVTARLDRLEKRVYGRTFEDDDLGDRVDRLRSRTGVDVATQIPTHYVPSLDDAGARSGPPRAPVAPSKTGSTSPTPTVRGLSPSDQRIANRWSPAQSRWQPPAQTSPYSVFPPRLAPPIAVELGPGVEEYSYEKPGRLRRATRRSARGYAQAWGRTPRYGGQQRQAGRGPMSPIGQAYAQPRPPANYFNRSPRQTQRHLSLPQLVAPPIAYGYGQDRTHPYGGYGQPAPRVYRSAPPYAAPHHPTYASPLPVALIPHVTALELRQFGIAYPWDSLPQRIGRLEAAMLPTEQSRADSPLTNRLARLVQLLPYGRWGGPLMAEQYRY